MTREDIIGLIADASAHDPGFSVWVLSTPHIERIVNRAVEAERERMTVNSIHSCHPDCQKPLCVNRRREIAAAVEAEREACKKLAQEHAARYRRGGRLYELLGPDTAMIAASACAHIVHLIEERDK